MNGFDIVEMLSWIIIASLIVFVVMNAGKVQKSVMSIGGWALNEQAVLVGAKAA